MTPTNPTTINDTDVGEVAADLPNVGRGALGAAGLAGVAYTLCMFFTSPDGPPVATATAQQVRDHVTSNGTTIQVAAIGGMLGITAALIFFAALTRQVRDRLPRSLFGDVVFSSGLLVVIYQWLMTTADAMTTLLPISSGPTLNEWTTRPFGVGTALRVSHTSWVTSPWSR